MSLPPDPSLVAFIREAGLAAPEESGVWTALAGGVSSDIWRVETRERTFCVKRALAQLRVKAQWFAPTGRNLFECRYFQTVAEISPGLVPTPLAHDPVRGMLAMDWLEPGQHRLWKTELLAARVDPAFAGVVGGRFAAVHAATAGDEACAARFASDDVFHALRIEAYLLATGQAHADLRQRFESAAASLAETKRALVHGDASPKNILMGPHGPVFLDAETAWFGDPAFDVAFCLNHLVIKARHVRIARADLIESAHRFRRNYFAAVDWEAPAGLERRVARLLPMLALARVDGKSPLEYLDEDERTTLRAAARRAVIQAPRTLEAAIAMLTA